MAEASKEAITCQSCSLGGGVPISEEMAAQIKQRAESMLTGKGVNANDRVSNELLQCAALTAIRACRVNKLETQPPEPELAPWHVAKDIAIKKDNPYL